MNKAEFLSNAVNTCISSARKILFGLSAFSVAAIYVAIISAYSLQEEISILKSERVQFEKLQIEGKSVLREIRKFYEGPAEANQINFSSFIYALEITRYSLDKTLSQVDKSLLSDSDIAFLDFQSRLIDSNAFELYSIMKGLIDQKQRRISFEQLSIPDLLDLDYHKGKGAWDLYYEWSSLRYSLYTPKSYGYRKLPADIRTLEQRYNYFLKESSKSRSVNTIPKKAGRDKRVTDYLAKVSSNGFRRFGELQSKNIKLDLEIEKKNKESEGMLKLPFVDQKIDFNSFIWIVPLTILCALLFSYFYLLKAKQILEVIDQEEGDSSYIPKLYAWVVLPQEKSNYHIFYSALILKILILGLPLFVSSFLVYKADLFQSAQNALGFFLTIISYIVVGLSVKLLIFDFPDRVEDCEPNQNIEPTQNDARLI